MASDVRKARDIHIIDAIDALSPEQFHGNVWRVVRQGRDPTVGTPSQSRWCNGGFDVLYTSLEKDGALAEIHSFLELQPVFPSKMTWFCYELKVHAKKILNIADLNQLTTLGVDIQKYKDRKYENTQSIADAAFFLGFDGLIATSARWPCNNLMLFTSRLAPDEINLINHEGEEIDWGNWRKRNQK